MEGVIFELTIVIVIAAVLAMFGKLIKQPPIIAYLFTGILVGPLVFDLINSTEVMQAFAHMGVAFLLFIVGLNLDFRVLKDVGKISLISGFGSMALVSISTFFIAIGLLGLDSTSSLFLSIAFVFSSTVVVVKLLSDKNELETLHGRIALGILIVEDFVAAIALMVIPVIGAGDPSLIFLQIGKSIMLIGGVFLFSHLFLSRALSIATKSQEVLFLFSVGWALLVAVIFDYLGFSLEIGALLAGMALASSKYSLEIKSKVKGLRDFFVVLFFVFFGSQLAGPITSELLYNATILSAFILFGKPLIVMTFMKFAGNKKRTNFFTGTSLAQVSEFSLIIVLLGFNLGIVTQELFSLTILVALITIATSSYMIYYSQPIYKKLAGILGIFDNDQPELKIRKKSSKYDIVLIGHNRIGFKLLKVFEKAKKKYLVVDYNPQIIKKLSEKGINCVYGDANDYDFLMSLRLKKAKIVISTIPELDTNLSIKNVIGKEKTIFIPTSHAISDTIKLYDAGADYVIMPHFLGGEFMGSLLTHSHFGRDLLDKEGKKQLKELKERLSEGHSHPKKGLHGS